MEHTVVLLALNIEHYSAGSKLVARVSDSEFYLLPVSAAWLVHLVFNSNIHMYTRHSSWGAMKSVAQNSHN